MHVSPRFLSSAVPIVLVAFLGATTLPLCAAAAAERPCAARMPGQTATDDGCHRAPAPAATLACCCDRDDGSAPAGPAVQGNSSESASPLAVSLIEAPVVALDVRLPADAAGLLTHRPPLFTLFSVFLI